jgi:hypothetical protein
VRVDLTEVKPENSLLGKPVQLDVMHPSECLKINE